jgi:hypothetical protein
MTFIIIFHIFISKQQQQLTTHQYPPRHYKTTSSHHEAPSKTTHAHARARAVIQNANMKNQKDYELNFFLN